MEDAGCFRVLGALYSNWPGHTAPRPEAQSTDGPAAPASHALNTK